MKNQLKYLTILFVVFVLLSGCSNSSNDKNLVADQKISDEAYLILDSINALDSADLIKINTRGCVGNCLPAETFSSLLEYSSTLEKLGYHIDWNKKTHRYSFSKKDSDK